MQNICIAVDAEDGLKTALDTVIAADVAVAMRANCPVATAVVVVVMVLVVMVFMVMVVEVVEEVIMMMDLALN